jgi:uncharacterized protein YyaL (SSP411 family)
VPNRLANETSPYLLQHADNPVDWYPWGPEAFERAKREDKPILLSIGYSACHWCHVMEHESFEDPDIARLMNEHFVNIKVDREERPDLDRIYMSAVQALTGHGGWPMTVFLTPDGEPFYGGTYFPPEDRGGMPGFGRVLLAIAEAYRQRRADVQQNARALREALSRQAELRPSTELLSPDIVSAAVADLARHYDHQRGGFGQAPKFPQPMVLEFLLRAFVRTRDERALRMAEHTLAQMARGGMYDHLGGGFHRYAVDAAWLVPHFEKMLYDNAQLARVYLDAYRLTGKPFYRRVVEETLDYVARDMLHPDGGFYATEDADSEGEEGKFYVWTPQEIAAVLGPDDGALFKRYYGVTPQGNFEGHSILHVPREPAEVAAELGLAVAALEERLAASRAKLRAVRARRVRPGRDEKIITSWNGLMLRAFAEAARYLGRDDYRQIAVRNAAFVLGVARRGDRLWHTWKDGIVKGQGFLEDYAYLADGLLALYETTFDERWFVEAQALAAVMVEHFHDDRNGGFFDTSDEHEALIARPKDYFDNATPSGNAVAADVLLRLYALTGDALYERLAVEVLRLLRDAMQRYPLGFGRALAALDRYLGPQRELAIIGEPQSADTQALLAVAYERYRPNLVVAAGPPSAAGPDATVPLLANRPQRDGRATAYLCTGFHCETPTTSPDELAAQFDDG